MTRGFDVCKKRWFLLKKIIQLQNAHFFYLRKRYYHEYIAQRWMNHSSPFSFFPRIYRLREKRWIVNLWASCIRNRSNIMKNMNDTKKRFIKIARYLTFRLSPAKSRWKFLSGYLLPLSHILITDTRKLWKYYKLVLFASVIMTWIFEFDKAILAKHWESMTLYFDNAIPVVAL